MNAQRWECEAGDRVVVGFDPSRYGGDPSTMVARAGSRVLWLKRRYPRSKTPGVELAGWLRDEMARLGASIVYVDEVGIGATVVDQGRVLGLNIVAVNGGKRAFNAQRFFNLRTECWWKIREALQHGELALPEDDLLTGDLTAPLYGYDEKGRVKLERKEEVKERLRRSPDSGDALALTYASPVEGVLPADANPVRELKTSRGSRWHIGERGAIETSRWRIGR